MALSKLSRKRRWLIKYLLAEEIEDEEVILQMYGGKRAKIHLMFELRNKEGIFQRLITNHLREDHNMFAEFFRLSVEQFDFLVELIKDDLSRKSYNRNLYPVTPEEKIAITLR